MNEHNIDNFMKLATNHNKDSDLTDNYYFAKYEEITSGKKYSFNWSAFLFSGNWCLYRKMYLYGILWMLFTVLYSAGIINVATYATGAASYDVLPIKIKVFLFPLQLAPGLFFGFIGNWLYVQQIHKKIDQGYHLSNVKNIDKLTWSAAFVSAMVFCIGVVIFYGLSFIKTGYMQYIPTVLNIFLASILGFVALKRDEKNVKMALAERALTEENSTSLPSE
ncbi:MAG: DUF2628 domain-containing protein [Pseudomonadota bacterium]